MMIDINRLPSLKSLTMDFPDCRRGSRIVSWVIMLCSSAQLPWLQEISLDLEASLVGWHGFSDVPMGEWEALELSLSPSTFPSLRRVNMNLSSVRHGVEECSQQIMRIFPTERQERAIQVTTSTHLVKDVRVRS